MWGVLISVVLTLALATGAILRRIVFRDVLSRTEGRILWWSNLIFFLGNALLLSVILNLVPNWTFFLKLDYFIFPIATTLAQALVLRNQLREVLFVYGITVACDYVLVGIPIYIVNTATATGLEFMGELLVIAVIYLYLCFSALCFMGVLWLLRRTVVPFLTLDRSGYWNTIWFIPIAMFLAMLLLVPMDQWISSLPQLLSRLFLGVATILMCLTIAKDHQHILTMQSLSAQLTMQKEHYDSMVERVEYARRIRHDFKHLRSAVRGYVDAGDKEGLFRFGQEFADDTEDDATIIPYTGNAAADGVLFHYASLAAREHIRLDLVGAIKSPGIADPDLCILLGNALDNALTGCLTRSEGRFISVTSQSEPHLLSVLVRNSFDGVVQQRQERLLSRKRNGAPGIGLTSMQDVCDRYGGSMQVQWDQSVFSVLFVLPLAPQNTE